MYRPFTARVVLRASLLCVCVLASSLRTEARPYSQVYVFGGMLEEIGNNPNKGRHPGAPYLGGRRTDGKAYVEHLAVLLGVPPQLPSSKGGTNYAWAPSDSPDRPDEEDKSLQMQIDAFEADLEDGPADPDALYVVGGFQDYAFGAGPDTVMAAIRRLNELGAKYFLSVEKIEPLSMVEEQNTVYNESNSSMGMILGWSAAAGAYNRELNSLAHQAQRTGGLSIFIVSYKDWLKACVDASLRLNIETVEVPSGYFNLIGWGTGASYSIPGEAAHEVLAGVCLRAVNRRPILVRPLEDVTLSIQDEPAQVVLDRAIEDPDLDRLVYTAISGDDSVLQVTVTGTVLDLTPVGDGTTWVTLVADDGRTQALSVGFSVTVRGLPGAISLAEASLDLGEFDIYLGSTITVTVENKGEGVLSVTGVASDVQGVSPSDGSFTVPPGGVHDLTLTVKPTAEGAFSGTVTILSDDPDRHALALPLSGTAVILPADPRTDYSADGKVDFADFLLFAQAFSARSPDARFDLDGNGALAFEDFLAFARSYGRPLP